MTMRKENEKRPRCSRCNASLVYIRIGSQELVCQRCGHIEKLEESKDKESKEKDGGVNEASTK